ncbi:MAG: hypothetical protein ACD_22C00106G0019 [uncultured bacterium]|nr:MAG: hypothetical protein ACD_22C00106G0019 [uncultured bacterium]
MINNNFSGKYNQLYSSVYALYHLPENKAKLLFHGWHHIEFVHDKAVEFAVELGARQEIVASAGLLHDLNYIFSDKLEPEAANLQIQEYLAKAGYDKTTQKEISRLIEDSHLGYRKDRELSNESKALADADTLFKALPTTPILFASKFITQNKYNIQKLATKIVDEQKPLMKADSYFYTEIAKKRYLEWAKINLALWENVLEALDDPAIRKMLETANELGVL